jgi:hypothetical protein
METDFSVIASDDSLFFRLDGTKVLAVEDNF